MTRFFFKHASLVLIFFLFGIHSLHAEKRISLVKSGGSIYLASGKPSQVLRKGDKLTVCDKTGSISNWTHFFNYFSRCISEDPMNSSKTTSYIIEIEANSSPYIIGKQDVVLSQKAYIQGVGIIVLKQSSSANSCDPIRNVTITGVNGVPKLKYADGLYYGSFLPPRSSKKICGKLVNNTQNKMVPLPEKYKCNLNKSTQAYIGNFIGSVNVENLNVYDINVDGNSNAMVIGGKFGDKMGRQLNHIGIRANSCKNMKVKNVNLSHFALDGFMLFGDSKNVFIESLICEYNGRQAFTWSSGVDLHVKDSKFNYSGQGIVESSPKSGLDIEPFRYKKCGQRNVVKAYCKNGLFENCEFYNNKGSGVISHGSPAQTYDIKFKNCKFHNTNHFNVYIKGRKFKFEDCKIWGGFLKGNRENVEDFGTVFANCDFANEPIPNKKNKTSLLLDAPNATFMRVENCSFRLVPNSIGNFIDLGSRNDNGQSNIIENCTFDQSKTATSGIRKNKTGKVKMRGQNSFDIKNTIDKNKNWQKGNRKNGK